MATNPLLPRREESSVERKQLSAVPSPVEQSEVNILLPPEFYKSFFARVGDALRDIVFPERYPPLRLTSRPVNVILPLGEMLRAPWYRTIFTSLGDVLAPENLPRCNWSHARSKWANLSAISPANHGGGLY